METAKIAAEQYVNFETAKLLKERDFDIFTKTRYDDVGTFHHEGYYLTGDRDISAPTQAMVMQWIRETHGVHISIKLAVNPNIKTGFYAEINRIEDGKWLGMSTMGENPNVGYDTYEEAAEKGIRFFLQDIIRML